MIRSDHHSFWYYYTISYIGEKTNLLRVYFEIIRHPKKK